MFRQQVAKNHNTDWSTLVSMFYSLTFLSQRVESVTCSKYMSPDHTERDCALNSLEDNFSPHVLQSAQLPAPKFRGESTSRPSSRRKRRDVTPTQSFTVCYSWNEGHCFRFPRECDRKHQCLRCGKNHKLTTCSLTLYSYLFNACA